MLVTGKGVPGVPGATKRQRVSSVSRKSARTKRWRGRDLRKVALSTSAAGRENCGVLSTGRRGTPQTGCRTLLYNTKSATADENSLLFDRSAQENVRQSIETGWRTRHNLISNRFLTQI